MRTDIVKVYRAAHTWVGILASLFLFIAFYCGSITMFEGPLRHWSAAASGLPPAPSLEAAPGLIRRALEAHPEARKNHTVHLEITPAAPARLTWEVRERAADDHAEPRVFGASLDAAGALVVRELKPSPVAQFIDTLHRQVGLPFDHDIALPVTAVVSLLYFLALVSGLVVLLPTLAKNLFLIRTGGRAVRRMWLDMHNTLGLLSLPFHLVIAVTALVFALHDEFYALQGKVISGGRQAETARPASPRPSPAPPAGAGVEAPTLPPVELRERLARQAPDFRLQRIGYFRTPAGDLSARVFGDDNRRMLRGATFGLGVIDPRTGELVSTDYFPGRQPALLAVVTACFSLHFGNFGGTPIRWAYVGLGLSGAFLFYTGNLLWIEARRRRLADGRDGAVVQPRSTRVLAALTVGVSAGTMAGVSLTIAAARWLPVSADLKLWHGVIYYTVLVAAIGWAFFRGAGRAGYELLWLCAIFTLAIPLSSLVCATGWIGLPPTGPAVVDLSALGGAVVFASLARLARRRALTGPADSVWAVRP